ncbi:MAG: hypothetical protein WBX15_11880 [Thermoanaerobaculia bacterium]
MASVSSVSIANRALQRLGATRITSLAQDHKNARSCNVAYDPVRRALLRNYAWSFAVKRFSVAADATLTTWGTLNRYQVPNDFLGLLRPTDARVDWSIEGQFIVTSDDSPLQGRYVFDATDPATFDALFVEAFACKLAYEICEDVTGATTKRQFLAQDLKQIVNEARQANSFELDPVVPVEDDFILAMR